MRPRLLLPFVACSLLLPGCDSGIKSGNLALPDRVGCTDFWTQEEAQAYFDENERPDALDGNGDGFACEGLPFENDQA